MSAGFLVICVLAAGSSPAVPGDAVLFTRDGFTSVRTWKLTPEGGLDVVTASGETLHSESSAVHIR